MVLFKFNVGPIKVSVMLPWKKSLKHLYANYVGAYNFLQKNLAHVNDLQNVEGMLRRKVDEMNPASLHRIENKLADEPKAFGQVMNLLKSPALPNAQRLLVNASAKPPVIENNTVDLAMTIKEGRIRQGKGYRFLEWPFQILNSLNLERFDHVIKMRDNDMDSQSSDTDENGNDDSGDDDEQGADADVQMAMDISPGEYQLEINQNSDKSFRSTNRD